MDSKLALNILLQWYATFCENESCGLVDTDFKVIADNSWCKNFCDSSTPLLGEDVFSIWKELSEVKKTILKQLLNKSLVKKNSVQFISANFSRKPEYVVALFEYKPLVNRYNGEVIAIQVSAAQKIYPLRFYDIKRMLPRQRMDDSVFLDNPHSLTLMECEIAFLLFQAEDYSEIADIMSIVYSKNISKSLIAKIVRTSL